MGLYMDQLVRRVDPHHRSLDQFFAEEVARKFGNCHAEVQIFTNFIFLSILAHLFEI